MHLSAMPSSSPRGSPGHISFSSSPKASPSHAKASPSRQQQQKDMYRSSTEAPSISNSPSRSSACGDSLSSASELSLTWAGLPEDQQAVERIQRCRKQLEDEVDVSIYNARSGLACVRGSQCGARIM